MMHCRITLLGEAINNGEIQFWCIFSRLPQPFFVTEDQQAVVYFGLWLYGIGVNRSCRLAEVTKLGDSSRLTSVSFSLGPVADRQALGNAPTYQQKPERHISLSVQPTLARSFGISKTMLTFLPQENNQPGLTFSPRPAVFVSPFLSGNTFAIPVTWPIFVRAAPIRHFTAEGMAARPFRSNGNPRGQPLGHTLSRYILMPSDKCGLELVGQKVRTGWAGIGSEFYGLGNADWN